MFIWEQNFPRRELGKGDVTSSCHFNFLFLNDWPQPFSGNTVGQAVLDVVLHDQGDVKRINWCL